MATGNARRSDAEIENAVRHLREVCAGAKASGDESVLRTAAVLLMALRWVQGDDSPGGFARVLRELDQIDRERENAGNKNSN